MDTGPALRMTETDWVAPERAWRSRRPLLAHRTVTGLAAALLAAGTITVIVYWWTHVPPATAVRAADRDSRVAQVAGLVAAYLILVEVVLMARFRALEHRLGCWLAATHRRLGGWLITAAAVHVVFVLLAHSAREHLPALTVLANLTRTKVGVLSATLGLLAMAGAGVASVPAVRRRLGYAAWHLVHLVMYPASVAVFYHQIALGAHFVRDPGLRAVWISAHAALAAAVLRNRVAVPLATNRRHRFRVTRVERTGSDSMTISVSAVRLAQLGVQPGQYFHWRFLSRGLWHQAHPFSISAAPDNSTLRLTVKVAGAYTRRLRRRLRPGVRVLVEGPYGGFTQTLRRRAKVLLIGGGVGVTPLRALAETMHGRDGDIVLIQRASRPADLILGAELAALDRARRIRYIPAVGRRGSDDPLSPRRLGELVPDIEERDVFVCASAGLTASLVKTLRRAGLPAGRIHVELFDF